jgi:hypothetical protein
MSLNDSSEFFEPQVRADLNFPKDYANAISQIIIDIETRGSSAG